jgi:SAM-dependent methyltransferase
VEYAREYFKLDNILFGNYEPGSYPPDSFDGIICHHTLEHILPIKVIFEAMRRHLKPGGYLLIQGPQIIEEKAYGKKGLNGGLHIYGFTKEFLTNALSGFILIKILETPHEIDADFPWEHLDEPVSLWGDTPGSISILCRKPAPIIEPAKE